MYIITFDQTLFLTEGPLKISCTGKRKETIISQAFHSINHVTTEVMNLALMEGAPGATIHLAKNT